MTTTLHQAPPPRVRVPHMRYLVLGGVCALAVVAYIHRQGFAVALPELRTTLKLDQRQGSYLTATFLIAYGIFEVPLGWLSDRFGSRHVLTIIALGWSLTTALVALVPSAPELWALPLLLGGRFLFGMFQAGGFPVIARALADWMPVKERGRAKGFMWTATRFGGLTAPFLFRGLQELFHGWQIPLVLMSLLGPLWCLAFWPWFRNRPEEAPHITPEERDLIVAGRFKSGPPAPLPWGRLLASRNVWGLCLMYGGFAFASNFYVTLLPNFLSTKRNLEPDPATWLTALPFAVGMVACLLGGTMSDWLSRRTGNLAFGRSGVLGGTLGVFGWLMLPHVHGVVELGLVLCFIFACNDLSIGPAWAAASDVGEKYAGTVGGCMNMMGSFAGAVGNLVAGTLFEQGNEQGVFLIYACSFGVGTLSWFAIDPRQKLTASPARDAEQPKP